MADWLEHRAIWRELRPYALGAVYTLLIAASVKSWVWLLVQSAAFGVAAFLIEKWVKESIFQKGESA